jgi:hypothetical protein
MPERVQSGGVNASVYDPSSLVCQEPSLGDSSETAAAAPSRAAAAHTDPAVTHLVKMHDGRPAPPPDCRKEGADVLKAGVVLAGGAVAVAVATPTVVAALPGIVGFIAGAVGFSVALAEYANCKDGIKPKP